MMSDSRELNVKVATNRNTYVEAFTSKIKIKEFMVHG